MAEIYTIGFQSKYLITFRPIENLEDAPDCDFVTRDELEEIVGKTVNYSTDHIFTDRIIKDLEEAAASIPKGKKSIELNDELVEFFKSNDYYLYEYMEGYLRRGNKLVRKSTNATTKKKVDKEEITFKTWKTLLKIFRHYHLYEKDIDVKILIDAHRENAVQLVVRSINWKDLEEYFMNNVNYYNPKLLPSIKRLYFNPNLAPQVKTKSSS